MTRSTDVHGNQQSIGPTRPSLKQAELQDWVMSVREPDGKATTDELLRGPAMNNNISSCCFLNHQSPRERPGSMSSVSSEDSVNLDDLINANFTVAMDDETDLPELSTLDLDDSKDNFWNVDASL
ncbi:hypothetical protein DFQ30_001187 [Apophysomyces sp. BC1015]|nr:hypothetical protein DFQ30_001187 [Apophysomyces sp. BC1015]KAG0181333.1 hypothetical protein DFQ29_008603 [Apophysomyces sp. BC1021]